MAGRTLIGVTIAAALVAAGNAAGPLWAGDQVPVFPLPKPRFDRPCLHGPDETPGEAARREEALRAARLIYSAAAESHSQPLGYLSWEALARSSIVTRLQDVPGPPGELARKIQWGAEEPLPGWRINYVAYRVEVRFALTDSRDPCAFAYSSADPEVAPRNARIVPLDDERN